MLRFVSSAVVLMLSVASQASADEDVMASRYGNTTIATNAKGSVTKTYYNADHTLTSVIDGQTLKGTWHLDGGVVCRAYEKPLPGMKNPECRPVQAARKVGETWTVGSGGDTITVKLVPGIQ
jgi:hypothetical protein